MRLTIELDETKHIARLIRIVKINGQTHQTDFATIALSAQAESLLKRAINAEPGYDCDCWLRATGTEFSDEIFQSKEYL